MPLFLSSSVVPGGDDEADSQWYRLRYRRCRCCWMTRTSYRLGHWLRQPHLLAEVSLEGHPLSPFAFRNQVLVFPVQEDAVVLRVLGRFVPEAAAAAVGAAATLREVVLESRQAHPAKRQT